MKPADVAEKSVDTVLEFYHNKEVPLSYRPELEYIDEKCSVRPDLIAAVRPELEYWEKYDFLLANELTKNLWKHGYKLDVSNEANEEFNKIILGKLYRKLMEAYNSEADIQVFQPYWDYIKEEKDSDEIIAHEIWHLIEIEREVLQRTPFITEGTATYAGKNLKGEKCDASLEDLRDFTKVVYLGAANVVQRHVADSHNPFISILNVDLRERIQKEFLDRTRAVLPNIAKNSIENKTTESLMEEYELMIKFPEFQSLKGNLNRQELIKAYRSLGASKLADELETQDLDFHIQHLRKIGF